MIVISEPQMVHHFELKGYYANGNEVEPYSETISLTGRNVLKRAKKIFLLKNIEPPSRLRSPIYVTQYYQSKTNHK